MAKLLREMVHWRLAGKRGTFWLNTALKRIARGGEGQGLRLPLTVAGVVAIGAVCVTTAGGARAGPRDVGMATADARCTPLALGVHVDLAYEKDAVRRASIVSAMQGVLGARIARSTLAWDRVEAYAGKRVWTEPDDVVNELTATGVEPLLVLMGSPAWANGTSPSFSRHQLYVPTGEQAFATWLRYFAGFAHDAARRYRGKVQRWEIWNEPNLGEFWRPQPNLAQYAETYQAVRAAILAADPNAKVAVGGLSMLAVAWGRGNVSGLSFLKSLIARGVRPPLVAVHPYTTPPHAPDQVVQGQDNFDDIARVHDLLFRHGIRTTIWVTEWGWSSQVVGLARQAEYVQRSLEMLRDRYPYVTVATYFIDHDRPPRFYQGLLDSSLRPKPAAARFAAFARNLQRCRDHRRRRTGAAYSG